MGFERYHQAIERAVKVVGRQNPPKAQSRFITEREAEQVALKLFNRLAVQLVDATLEEIAVAAEKAHVTTPIGTFRTATRAARRLKNFQKAWVNLPAQRQLSFTARRSLRARPVDR